MARLGRKTVSGMALAGLVAVAIIGAGGSAPVGAAGPITRTWVASLASNFSNPDAWSPVGVPANGDNLVFPGGSVVRYANDDLPDVAVGSITVAGNFTITGNVLLDSAASVHCTSGCSLQLLGALALGAGSHTIDVQSSGKVVISAVVSGSSGLRKTGAGTLWMSTTNTYTGETQVAEGTLSLGSEGALGSPSGATTVSPGATLDARWGLRAEPVTLEQSATLGFFLSSTFGGPLTLAGNATISATNSAASEVRLTAPISGPGALRKVGSGMVSLHAASTYSGGTAIESGSLVAASDTAVGSGAVTVDGGATFRLDGGITFTNPITATGSGLAMGSFNSGWFNSGAIVGSNGTNTLAGTVTINGDTTIASEAEDLKPRVQTTLVIAGTISGSGKLTLGGKEAVRLSGSGAAAYTGATSISGTVFAGRDGSNRAVSSNLDIDGYFVLERDEQIPDAARVGVSGGFTLAGHHETIGSLNSFGNLRLKGGTGGAQESAVLAVNGSAYLHGVHNSMFQFGTMAVGVAGTGSGVEAGQLRAQLVQLSDVVLEIWDEVPPPIGSVARIIDNTGTAQLTGTFSNLPEGSRVNGFGGTAYTISYRGGTGNDVTLRRFDPAVGDVGVGAEHVAPDVTLRPPDPAVGDVGVGAEHVARGYWMLDADGTVYGFGAAPVLGDAKQYMAPLFGFSAVKLEPTATRNGYWIVDNHGRVYTFGDAPALGNAGPLAAGELVSSLSSTPTGKGYWIFTNRGSVFARGDATFYGDMSAVALQGPVLGSVATPSGKGYYMVASDGGIFAFGDAHFFGSMGGKRLNAPVGALVPTSDNGGYWLVASDGGVFAFGNATFRGSMGGTKLNRPIVGMVRYGDGYLMVGNDGGIFNFSSLPFSGSLGANPPALPITSVAAYA